MELPKVVTIYLTDAETEEIERLCEEMGVVRYKLIKMAIREFCASASGSPSGCAPTVEPSSRPNNRATFSDERNRENLPVPRPRSVGYAELIDAVKGIKGVCGKCGFPILDVSLDSCPKCGHTKYKRL